MTERRQLVERAQFVNIRGEIETGLLRIVPRVPGRRRNELPREVPISSVPAPVPKIK